MLRMNTAAQVFMSGVHNFPTRRPISRSRSHRCPQHTLRYSSVCLPAMLTTTSGQKTWPRPYALGGNNHSKFSCKPYENKRLYNAFVCAIIAQQDISNRRLYNFTVLEIQRLLQRSLFRTVAVYLGTGNNQVLPVDEVIIFKGAETPFLVRRVANREHPEARTYMLVSDCYLHGLMDGCMLNRLCEETEITLV